MWKLYSYSNGPHVIEYYRYQSLHQHPVVVRPDTLDCSDQISFFSCIECGRFLLWLKPEVSSADVYEFTTLFTIFTSSSGVIGFDIIGYSDISSTPNVFFIISYSITNAVINITLGLLVGR